MSVRYRMDENDLEPDDVECVSCGADLNDDGSCPECDSEPYDEDVEDDDVDDSQENQ